jgi:hypothetical protein
MFASAVVATWDGFAASKHLAALMTVKENA